jgi:hypothetical protein
VTEGFQPPGYQPPTSRSSGTSADQDTTTLPRLSPPDASQRGSQPADAGGYGADGGWSAPSRSDDPRRAGTAQAEARQAEARQAEARQAEARRAEEWRRSEELRQAAETRGATASDAANGGIGARLAAAASAAAATATGAAHNAKGAMRTAADEAEANAARPSRRAGRAGRQPRRARLTLSHLNVYSIFKFSCVLAIALFFVWLIMVGVLYGILDVSGVFGKVNDTVHTISGDGKTNDVVTGSLVFGGAIIIGVVNIVLFIALSTIGAMVYNLCADLVGGAEVTLSERE